MRGTATSHNINLEMQKVRLICVLFGTNPKNSGLEMQKLRYLICVLIGVSSFSWSTSGLIIATDVDGVINCWRREGKEVLIPSKSQKTIYPELIYYALITPCVSHFYAHLFFRVTALGLWLGGSVKRVGASATLQVAVSGTLQLFHPTNLRSTEPQQMNASGLIEIWSWVSSWTVLRTD
jgi:hypothetical protein